MDEPLAQGRRDAGMETVIKDLDRYNCLLDTVGIQPCLRLASTANPLFHR